MRAFVGIGTGRCGTRSLAKLVGVCKNTAVSHEAYASNWYKASANIGKLILSLKASGDVLTGDVSCALTPHIQALRDPIPDLKVVCLHRSKEEVVKSFMSWAYPSNLRPSDRVIRTKKFSGTSIPNVVDYFPVIDAASPKQAWGFYWEYVEELMSLVKEPVKHVWMKSLGDDYCLKSIYDFLDIPTQDVVPSKRRVWNSSQEQISGYRNDSRPKSV